MKKRCNFLILVTFLGFSINPVLLHGQGCENLISYWRLEEKMGNTYTDIIGGHDAVTISSAPSQVDGKVGKAQSFNGTSDYISISDHPDFDWSGTQSFTIEMWVKLNSIATVNNMVFIGRDETEGNIHWWIGAEKNTGKSTFVLYDSENSTNTSYGPSLSIDTWYHLVAVRDAESGNNLFYVNNTLVDSDSVDYSNGSFETDATIDIGVLNYNGETNRFFAPAVIDEVAIYDAALTINDVNLHYNNGVFGIGYCEDYAPYFLSFPDSLATVETEFFYEAYATGLPPLSYSLVSGPGNINSLTGVYSWTPTSPAQSGSEITISATNSLGTAIQSFRVYVAEELECPSGLQHYYKLNEDSGPPYTDFTGENNGEALNAPSPTAGKFSRAQQFDGVSNGINLPDVGTFNFPGSSSFSFEFWMKTPGKSSTMVCIGRQGTFGETDTSKLHLWVGVEATGEASFYLRDADANEPEPDGLVKGGIVNDNTWHYIVAVRDGVSRKNFLYVDGRQVAVSNEFTYSNSFGTFEGDPFNIGFLYRPKKVPDYFFNGVLDEVAIYNKALSAREVAANYLQSFSGKWHCEPDNNAPAFLTDPVTSATEGEAYSYDIETNDIDQDDVLILSAPTIPGWLTFTDLNNGRATLSGTPLSEDIGPHSVLIQVTDGTTTVDQSFTITVVDVNDPVGIDEKVNLVQHVYPVPANEQLIIELDIIANCTITVIDMTGKHLIVRTINGTEKRISIGISNLGEGFYICKIQSGSNISIHSFIISR